MATKKQTIATNNNFRLKQLKGMEVTLTHYGYDLASSIYSDAIWQRECNIVEQLKELQVLYKLHRDAVLANTKN